MASGQMVVPNEEATHDETPSPISIPTDVMQELEGNLGSRKAQALEAAAAWCVANKSRCLADIGAIEALRIPCFQPRVGALPLCKHWPSRIVLQHHEDIFAGNDTAQGAPLPALFVHALLPKVVTMRTLEYLCAPPTCAPCSANSVNSSRT